MIQHLGVVVGKVRLYECGKCFRCKIHKKRICLVLEVCYFNKINQCVQSGSSKACGKVVKQESFPSPHLLQNSAKHPKCQHIKHEVVNPPVHEHMGYNLVGAEVLAPRIVEPEQLYQVYAETAAKHVG